MNSLLDAESSYCKSFAFNNTSRIGTLQKYIYEEGFTFF